MPVVFAFIPFVIKTAATKIPPVLPFKNGAIVFVIIPVAVMPAPGGIGIISIPGIIPFIYDRSGSYMGTHTNLGISGTSGKTCGHYQEKNK